MSMDELLAAAHTLDGVLDLAPDENSPFPDIAWGDHFLYYAPDGQVPTNEQPYATFVTKDYPGDTASRLDEPGRWRLNVHVGAERFHELLGEHPGSGTRAWDHAVTDEVLPHPVYGGQGWVSIVDPGARTHGLAVGLLQQAHEDARRRAARRSAASTPGADPGQD